MNIRSLKHPFIIPLSIILLISLFFLILQPTLRERILPRYRSFLVRQLIESASKNHTIDPQQFWMTREFTSSGFFTYRHEGLHNTQLNLIKSKVLSNIHITPKTLIFLTYESESWNSMEALVHAPDISSVVKEPLKGSKLVVLETPTDLIFYESPHILKIIFIKPISEMKKANAFFDFNGHDKNLVDGRFWLSISTISI